MSHLCSFFEVEAAEGILIAVTEDREEQEEDRGQIPLAALAMTWRGKNILPGSVERKKESRQFDQLLANLIPRTFPYLLEQQNKARCHQVTLLLQCR